MIKNFSDHAANERTFLAWVRTSIAVIAFGFLVERFDLFLAVMLPTSASGKIAIARNAYGHLAGLVLIVLGMIMIIIAAIRFARTAKETDDESEHPGTGSRVDRAPVTLLVGARFFYFTHVLTARAWPETNVSGRRTHSVPPTSSLSCKFKMRQARLRHSTSPKRRPPFALGKADPRSVCWRQ
jgi:putative membrane protein